MREVNQNVHKRKGAQNSKAALDLLGAVLIVTLCISVIWGIGWAYQTGYEIGCKTAEVHRL